MERLKLFMVIALLSASPLQSQTTDDDSYREQINKDRKIELIQDFINELTDNPRSDCISKIGYSLLLLFSNQRIDEANVTLLDMLNTYPIDLNSPFEDHECYFRFPVLQKIYLDSSCRQRLNMQVRQGIEEMMLNLIYFRSAYNPSSVWEIQDSENHDIIQKGCYWAATLILRLAGKENEILPDGKSVLEHYQKWNSYFKLYFETRAREGIFEEVASSYNKYTLSPIYDINDYAPSETLQQQANQFLTLYWADVAQEFLPTTGMRGRSNYTSLQEQRVD